MWTGPLSEVLADVSLREAIQEASLYREDFLRRFHWTIGGVCADLYGEEADYWDGPNLGWGTPKNAENREPEVSAAIVPLHDALAQANFVTTMLKKTTLYTGLTVLVLPVELEYLSISYSLYGKPRLSGDVRLLLEYNKRYEDLVNRGRCVFLPRRYLEEEETLSFAASSARVAPLAQRPDNAKYLPLNVRSMHNSQLIEEQWLGYRDVVLPYFPNASLEAIADVADKETDAFIRFNSFLTTRLRLLEDCSSPQQIREVFREIDAGVAALRIEASKLRGSKLLNSIELAFFTVSVGVLTVIDQELAKQVAGIVGSLNALQLMRNVSAAQNQRSDLRKSEFYFPYLLDKAHGAS